MIKTATSCALVLTLLMIGACGGSDGSAEETAENTEGGIETQTPVDDANDDASAPGFGELIEGTFLLSGAEEEQYSSTDEDLDFRMSGGCQGGAFGFGTNVQDPAGTATLATFGAQGPTDLSGGATGEFDDVDLEVTVFAVGDMSVSERYEGPVRMIISEHDTGGVAADANARRMTVTLLGSVTGPNGDVDVDVTYRWAMGCP